MGFNSSSGGGSGNAAVLTPGQIIPYKNLNNVWTKKLLHNVTLGAGAIGNTFGCIIKAPCKDFTHVRLVFANGEATPGAISGASIAVTNSNADKVTPSTGSGLTNNGATGWVQVKFSGANTVTLPAAGADVNNPGMLYSDWMAIDSIAPTDSSGNLPYLLARVRYSNAFSYLYQGMDSTTQTKTSAQYMETYHTSGNTDAIGTPGNLTQANKNDDPAQPFFAFEFRSSVSPVRVVCVGDSISNGYPGSSSTAGGFWQQAQDLFVAASIPVNLFQGAIGGTTTTAYATFGKAIANFHNPAIAVYSVWSPNDGSGGASAGGLTQANMNACFARAMDFADYCKALGIMTVFNFLAPNDAYSSGDDALLLALVARCQATSIPVIDLTKNISTATNPRDFISGYSADGVHPNFATNTIMANDFKTQLLAIIRKSVSI